MATCCVCNRDWPEDKCRTLTLTDTEKSYIRTSVGQDPPETFLYCNPCWRVLSDRLMGAQFIKGTLQVQMQARGVGNAEELSQRYFDRLLALTSKPKS
jgi:hypothetical protein